MTIEVRAANEDDIAAIRAVGELTWPTTYAFAGDEYVARGLATWSEDPTSCGWSVRPDRSSVEP
jgi:hypothetical protein